MVSGCVARETNIPGMAPRVGPRIGTKAKIAAKNPKKKGNLIPSIDRPIKTKRPTAEAKINCA